MFAGGWLHDSESMTEAFNLQTPSMLIDMRFPVDRPTEQLRRAGSVEACSDDELMQLAQQHCFAGYSLPSEGDTWAITATSSEGESRALSS